MSEKSPLDPQSTSQSFRPGDQEQGPRKTEGRCGPDIGRQADLLQRLTLWELALFSPSMGTHNGPAGNPSVNLAETPTWLLMRRRTEPRASNSNLATTARTQSASKESSFVDPTVATNSEADSSVRGRRPDTVSQNPTDTKKEQDRK